MADTVEFRWHDDGQASYAPGWPQPVLTTEWLEAHARATGQTLKAVRAEAAAFLAADGTPLYRPTNAEARKPSAEAPVGATPSRPAGGRQGG